MTAAEFWELTPRQFDALYDRFLLAEERADMRAAKICETMANIYRNPEKKPEPFHVNDFFRPRRGVALELTLAREQREPPLKHPLASQSVNEMVAMAHFLTEQFKHRPKVGDVIREPR